MLKTCLASIFLLANVVWAEPRQQAAPAPAASAFPLGSEAPADEAETPVEPNGPSKELEELKALEETTLDPRAKSNAELFSAIGRLGLANPLRERMLDAFEQLPTLDEVPADLPRITDLALFDVGVVKDQYDIPVEMQPLVAQYIQFFQGPGRKWFRRWMSRSSRFIPMMQPILESRGIPKDTVYLAMIESGFSVDAESWANAVGPWQFISGTAKMMGLRVDFWVDERKDFIKSTHAAAKYLTILHKDLGHWYLAWAGYNAGGGRLRRVVNRRGTSDFWELSEGKGLARETKHYVPKLIACALVAKHYKAFGFSEDEFDYQEPLNFDRVAVPEPTDLEVLAKAAGVSTDALRELNPELRRWCTPPASDEAPYMLRVPKGTADTFAENFAKMGPKQRLAYKIHRVRRGETLSQIAYKYGTHTEAILQFNRMRSARLKVNSELVVPIPSSSKRALASRDDSPHASNRHARRSSSSSESSSHRVRYAVKSGDTLWTIAQRFSCSVEDLQRWNSLPRRSQTLPVGKVLTVSGDSSRTKPSLESAVAVSSSSVVEVAGKASTHRVAAGDTLWSVAHRYGVSVEDLARWNRLSDARVLRAGQELRVMSP
jgi:membrane-bound lytic murein transglycosylase D